MRPLISAFLVLLRAKGETDEEVSVLSSALDLRGMLLGTQSLWLDLLIL